MPSNFATVTDVQDVWPQPLATVQQGIVNAYLGYAALLIRQAAPEIDSWLAAGTMNPGVPRYVSVSMIRDYLLNPEGRKSGTRTIDDFTESWTLADAVAAGGMTLTGAMLAMLVPSSTTPSRGAFTIRPTGTPPAPCW